MRLALMAAVHLAWLSTAQAAPRWARDPSHITVDLKGANVRALISALAESGRMNVVIADSISGSVTLKIRDLPWDEALAAVLRAKELGMEREGNILRVDTAARFAEEKAQAAAVAQE